MLRRNVLVSLVTGLLLTTISGQAPGAETLRVYTVNYPLQYFAERIAGEHAEVLFPAPPGADPAFWSPSVEVIGEYQQADLIVLNGAGYAKWTAKVSLPRARVVDSSKAFSDRYISTGDGPTHSHGGEGDHSHTGTAFTTWLDFELASLQAQAIAAAMERKRPELADAFRGNLASLEQDLTALDKSLRDLTAESADLPLLASHPVYQYAARRYGLNLESVLWEPDTVPDEQQWTMLEALLREHPAQWMIWEGPPLAETAERLGTLGVQTVVFDPAGNTPSEGDWLSLMRENLDNIAVVFAKP